MKISFNGISQEVAAGTSIAEFLVQQGVQPAAVVAERNGEILDAGALGDILNEGDVLNAFRVVAGG